MTSRKARNPNPLMNVSVNTLDQTLKHSILLSALPDTGSNKSLISCDFLERNNLFYTKTKSSSRTVLVANSSTLNAVSEVCLSIMYENITTPAHFLVCSNLHVDCLLSWNDVFSMDIILENFRHRVSEALSATVTDTPPNESIDTLINEYQDVFNEDKITPMTCLLYTSPSPRDRG